MIVFDLQCLVGGEVFEAWFGSNADFDRQLEAGLIACPSCQSKSVAKAPMAPLIQRGASDDASNPHHPLAKLATLQADLLRNSRWVGGQFAETARAMHLGETESDLIHGHATAEDANPSWKMAC